ncbi:MAG TPA: hypothetical protein VEU32_15650 [Burkholderiales bacterium]|nr:hypothetical protein [Burkholderiales bacterium]
MPAQRLRVLIADDEGHQVREVLRGDAAVDAVLRHCEAPARGVRRALPGARRRDGVEQGTHRMYGKIAGFTKYITKPYDPAALLALLPVLAR